MRPQTPSQTVGPFLSIALSWPDGPFVVPPGTPGTVWVHGQVLDGAGEIVPDALVETWQADTAGRFDHPDDNRGAAAPTPSGFRGFGRSETPGGEYAILTVKPGALPDGAGGWQAPHLDVSIFARGLLDRLVTRIYFADEQEANDRDDVLATLPSSRRQTLLAVPDERGYRLDLVLHGGEAREETVFFSV